MIGPLHSSPEGAQSFIRELDHIQINVVDRGALQSLSVVNLKPQCAATNPCLPSALSILT